MMSIKELKSLLASRDKSFWAELERQSRSATAFNELIFLSSLRKKAQRLGLGRSPATGAARRRLAIIGGSTLYPLSDLIEHMLDVSGLEVEVLVGDYDNYRSEILDPSSRLYQFQPNVVVILPAEQSCRYTGKLSDPRELPEADIQRTSSDLLKLCEVVNERTKADVILCNYTLPPYFDLGSYTAKSLGSDWNFRRAVNLALGTNSPSFVHICDLEFLAYRLGGLAAKDERSWFESKQLYSPPLQVAIAKEIAHLVWSLKSTPKKILVLDLDNTLWGGVVGDDGLEGIEIGTTSPRGEAFKAFQSYILSLTERGVLLGVCSKNDFDTAIEPFRQHPEMVLREEHFVSIKANWEPKPDNLKIMATELGLGLDSFVFVDDNPAELEIVRQFAPEVTTILLGPDPSDYVTRLKESRLFERLGITDEDVRRTRQYREETRRQVSLSNVADMDVYLGSLEMSGTFREFSTVDVPRIAQLTNKSNQFNLTTKRRTEAELLALMLHPGHVGFTMRLRDRFGDHGLICVVICHQVESTLEIDTWLMSCRVLKRQAEEEVLNEIVRLARVLGAGTITGKYLATPRNGMVKDLYPRLGFQPVLETDECSEFALDVSSFNPIATHITIDSRTEQNGSHADRSDFTAPVHI